jgi:DNA-binding response OmpR family regulator
VYLRRRSGPRPDGETGDVVVLDEVTIDLHRHAVTVAGRSVTLTRKEFQVLALLASSGGAVCTRNRIVAEVWGRSWAGANRTLDVHIATLRTKLGRADLVQTVRGVGYRLGLPEAAHLPDVDA